MRNRAALIGLALIVAGVTPALAAEDDPRWSFSTSVNYSVGDYGTNKDTTIVYVPFTLGVRPIDRLWLSLTLPYIYQSSENVVVTGGGVAKRKRGGGGKFAAPERSTSESGLGDMLLRVSYVVLEERELIPEISPYQSDPVELRVGAEYRLAKALKLTGAVTRGLTDGAADWGLSAGLTLRF